MFYAQSTITVILEATEAYTDEDRRTLGSNKAAAPFELTTTQSDASFLILLSVKQMDKEVYSPLRLCQLI